MNSFQIEAWAYKVIERVETGQPDEDFKVELKSDWPDVQKAARRLAAHANAARGEPILWLIGVDQKSHTIVGASHMEVSSWYEQVKAEFDDRLAPLMKDLNFSYKGKSVVALFFETDRFPFVVKTTDGRLEVPWREGTLTRSAHRSELLKLLVPLQFLPTLEVLGGEARIKQYNNANKSWRVYLELYIEPKGDMRLVIPFHRCRASLEVGGVNVQLTEVQFLPPAFLNKNFSKTIENTNDELLVYGPGKVNFSAFASIQDLPQDLNCDIEINASLMPVGAEYPVLFTVRLEKSSATENDKETLHLWKLKDVS